MITSEEWNKEVFPHSKIQQLYPNLWIVQGEFPQSRLPRNMVIYRYDQDKLLLHSVVALEEKTMKELECYGKPTIMVVPNWDHWAHIAAFKKRYPDIIVTCPKASIEKVELKLHVDTACEDLFPFKGMIFHIVPGIIPYEGVFEFPLGNNRVAIVMNDLITNVPHQKGFNGFLLRITKSSGQPNVIPIVRKNLKAKTKTVKNYLKELAEREDIDVLTTSHGTSITQGISSVISNIADAM
jgi:hypothetical protein